MSKALSHFKSLPFVARKVVSILKDRWHYGKLILTLPNGTEFSFEGKQEGLNAHLQIQDYNMLARILTNGDIGFAESYMAGEWDTPDLMALLEAFSQNLDHLPRLQNGNSIFTVINNWLFSLQKNSRKGAKKNIYAHYDLGNRFYGQWLDQSMTYSSALFDRSADLVQAQKNKYEAMCQMVGLFPGAKVLEIGCGWGGFAQYAAETYQAQVTCLTISQAQADYARARIEKAGLSHLVEIKLLDYRDCDGVYDAIVSIEMFEAVGESYWPVYFDTLKARLKPGAKAGLQIITMHDDLFEDYKGRTDFIQKYVFPGGMLPSLTALTEQVKRIDCKSELVRQFGQDYAKTLRLWNERFEAAWNDSKLEGFDSVFKKLWQFYLAYCQAGFATERTNVIHMTVERPVA
jgi:cyclopropane-fatty-acyl-phospholipid synthase